MVIVKKLLCLIFGHKWRSHDSEMIAKTETSEYYYMVFKCLRCNSYKTEINRFIKRDIEKEVIKVYEYRTPLIEYFKSVMSIF
jgi:hypothetical protein